jgi:N-acetylglucosaminyldiphosphoundecaprenol N-acetyl-beta-D-mannosaminyltransferase
LTRKINFMGVRFDSVALPEAVEKAMALLEGGGGCIVTPNAEIVYGCRETEGLRDVLNAAALTLPDGIGVVYASKILKRPPGARVAGIDFAAGLHGAHGRRREEALFSSARGRAWRNKRRRSSARNIRVYASADARRGF